MAKLSSAVLFARAEDAFLHAAITGDPEILADAQKLQRRAEAKSAKETTLPKRERLELRFLEQDAAAGDLVAKALVGEVELEEFVAAYELGQVEPYLTSIEKQFLEGRNAAAVRFVVLARHTKQSLTAFDVPARTAAPTARGAYVLAARGHLSNRDRAVVSDLISDDLSAS